MMPSFITTLWKIKDTSMYNEGNSLRDKYDVCISSSFIQKKIRVKNAKSTSSVSVDFFLVLPKKNTELILERKSRSSMLYRSHEGCLHLSAFSIRARYTELFANFTRKLRQSE